MTFYPRVWIALLSVLSLILAPTSQPSSIPPEQRQIGTWLSQLADPDPDVRDAAREALMGLRVAYLDTLKQAISDARPLAPAQAAALRDIVRHVYLASLPYAVDPNGKGFLGIMMGSNNELPTRDVVVFERYPGFIAYRMLRDGDVLVSADGQPINDRESLQQAIGNRDANARVRLEVQRGGRLVSLTLNLSPRPASARLDQLASERASMLEDANAYWDENFATLVEAEADPSSPTTTRPATRPTTRSS